MIARLVAFLALLPAVSFAAVSAPAVSLTFNGLDASSFVQVYRDACYGDRGLVVDPSVTRLETPITLDLRGMSCASLEQPVRDVLASIGLRLDRRTGYDYLTKLRAIDERQDWETVVYVPRNRDVAELADMVGFAVRQGQWSHKLKQVALKESTSTSDTGSNGASVTAAPSDRLIYNGPPGEAKVVRALLEQLDTMPGQAEIRAGIYEFSATQAEGSALSVVGKLLSGRFGVSIGSVGGGDSLSIQTPSLDAVLSLLDTDQHFRYVARPKVTTRDGQKAHFFSGTDQRVVGSTTLDNTGRPIQSMETLSAGVTLEVTPKIHGESTDLTIYEAVSSFVASGGTEPTINKRDLTTRLGVRPGAVYVIGGLQSHSSSNDQSRFFRFKTSDTHSSDSTEILLLISVEPVQQSL